MSSDGLGKIEVYVLLGRCLLISEEQTTLASGADADGNYGDDILSQQLYRKL